VCSSLGNFDLVVDGAKCSRILTHQPVNQNCTSNLNLRIVINLTVENNPPPALGIDQGL
jgi:hypothetical protein